MASGMVWVRPGKLPAKMMVAPNSPRARAQVRAAPPARPGAGGRNPGREVDQRLKEPLQPESPPRENIGNRRSERDREPRGGCRGAQAQPHRLLDRACAESLP